MTNKENSINKDNLNPSMEVYQKNIEIRKKTAVHLDAATKYHLEEKKYNDVGEHRKACQCAIKSKEQLRLASESIIEAIYDITLNNDEFTYQPF